MTKVAWGVCGSIVALTFAFLGLTVYEAVKQRRAAQQRLRDRDRDRWSRIAAGRERSEYDATYREEVRAAEERARGLLLSHLDALQQDQLNAHGSFQVVGSNGGRYTINTGIVSNVTGEGMRRDGLDRWTTYCLYAPGVPISDSMLMQKLLLETNETKFVRDAVT